MPQLPYSIEIHDSRLEGIELRDGAAVLKLRPAYIHREGKGWRQDADIIVNRAHVDSHGEALPAKLADGRMKTGHGPYHNLLMLPLSVPGPVELSLELFSERELRVCGDSATVVLHGEPVYVEDFA